MWYQETELRNCMAAPELFIVDTAEGCLSLQGANHDPNGSDGYAVLALFVSTNGEKLYVRTGPSQDCSITGALKNGTLIYSWGLFQKDGNGEAWLEIRAQCFGDLELRGWVMARYVSTIRNLYECTWQKDTILG